MKFAFAVLENIAVLALIGFLFYLSRSWWPFLLLLFLNSPSSRPSE